MLLFDKDTSGMFRRATLHLHVAVSHAYSVGQTLCMTIGLFFGADVIPNNWKAFAQSLCKKNSGTRSYTHERVTVPVDLDMEENWMSG